MKSEKPFGFEVTYEARVSMGRTEHRQFRCKGTESTARTRAKWKIGYAGIVSLEPFTEEQYIRVFGIHGSKM